MPVEHYENFPVASWLLPKHLRPAVEAIYWWARTADDLADEGDASAEQRLSALAEMQADLERITQQQTPEQTVSQRLVPFIHQYQLPLNLFSDLLSAFSQDVSKARYANFDEVLDYCRRSANPIGRLMLHLYKATDPASLRYSDAICTGLQITNFWQDVAIDWKKNRVYLPQDSLARFGVTETQIAQQTINAAWRDLMHFEVERAHDLLVGGAPLVHVLPGRVGWELRLVVQGGLRILERIEQVDYDVFRARPTLKYDWPLLLWRAARMQK